ncbi:hypothetical protein TFLX_01792 [Thermoflexales bacterium]|nr:hypothetical protein TFLX_01792 [Thermoflexales bacterium]
MNTTTICQDDARRETVRARPELNGLDYVEVADDQLTLNVYFLGKAPEAIQDGTTQYVRIAGGRRIRDIQVVDVEVVREDDPELDDLMIVRVDRPGDFSTYTLRLVDLDNIDPFYDHVEFSFKVNCPSDLDCAPGDTCPPPAFNEPEINYLAKDYASFRQLILDRLALIMPEWQERHVPDLGIALVEVLAYVGDQLSYYQDAVATEAYLETARQRISVRRHARLVDYVLHEGCNARAWLCLTTDTDWIGEHALDPREVYFITNVRDVSPIDQVLITADDLRNVPASAYEVFEALSRYPIELYAFQSEVHFYTWGERECCLPRGATSATLIDAVDTPPIEKRAAAETPARKLHLKLGDVLIFKEVLGPKTGQAADADPTHRHAVRLTKITPDSDPLNGQPIVEVEWSSEDALPFPLCLSATTDAAHGCAYHDHISVACGNVILVDHGLTIEPHEDLGRVPTTTTEADCNCAGHPADVRYLAGKFRPRLAQAPLTYRQTLPADTPSLASAASWLQQDVHQALPQVYLTSLLALRDLQYQFIPWAALSDQTDLTTALYAAGLTPQTTPQGVPFSPDLYAAYQEAPSADLLKTLVNELTRRYFCWRAQLDLLSSGSDDRHFVVELDNDGVAWLRFGDEVCGQPPEAGSSFSAEYRIGNGTRGNVGAESIAHLVFRHDLVSGATLTVSNPLPARGGTNAEPLSEAKLFAPSAFRKVLSRAITVEDYAYLAQREFKTHVQRAAAVLAWTGSWFEADVALDPSGSAEAAPILLDQVAHTLQRYRRIGHDLEVQWAAYVPIELELSVCVLPHFLRGHVKAALLDVFSNRNLSKGQRGFFHPDNLSFGVSLYVSQLVAVAQAVPGVESVRVTKLKRQFGDPQHELENGVLPLSPLEVARLDNDPNYPERGQLTLVMRGGR